MPEVPSEPNLTPAEVPALFRLDPGSSAKATEALRYIRQYGMGDPWSTRRLLSLFRPEEFTDDPFHILGSKQPHTLWDQVAGTAADEKNLTGDQKVAVISIKRFALQSLAENSSLDEPVRDAAKTELREYDATVAKILDPDDPTSARFFDRAKAAGKLAGKAGKAGGAAYLVLSLMGCNGGGILPTPIEVPSITPNPAFTQTVPGIESPTPDQFEPTPTDVYHFGSGGPISIERLLEMESQDPTIVNQIEWLNIWGDWYGSADPSIRPMTSGEARTDIVFYEWTGGDGSIHYKAAWKFDAGYPGYILVPPAINWEELNPPVAAPAGHEIGPGQGPVLISIECLEGSDLAKLGVPAGAKLSPEQGTGNWVMVFNDKVVARVDTAGVWMMETPTPTETPIETPTVTPIPFENGPSLEFSPLFPAEWHKEFTGKVEGMDIPIIIGLSDGVVHDKIKPITPITSVWMTKEGANAVVDAFLRAAHHRYTKLMGNTISYEDYLTLLKQPTGGEVLLLITDNTGARREAWINPRQGFSMLISDTVDPKVGVRWDAYTNEFYGVDGKGRFLFASDFFSAFDLNNPKEISSAKYDLIWYYFQQMAGFGWIKNECLAYGDVLGTCGMAKAPPENFGWWKMLVDLFTKYLNGQGPLVFGLERP